MAVRTFGAMDPTKLTVAGERVSDLVRVFPDIETEQHEDGGGRVSVQLDVDAGDPFVRALLRIEAELLLRDADGTPDDLWRAPEERRADAFVELFERLREATAGSPTRRVG